MKQQERILKDRDTVRTAGRKYGEKDGFHGIADRSKM